MDDNGTENTEFHMDWYGIGQRIKAAREKAGLTQEKLAQKAGIRNARNISALEALTGPADKRQVSMTAENLARLALALEVSLDYLTFGKKEEKKPILPDGPDWSTLLPYGECINHMLDYLYTNIIVRDYSVYDNQIIFDKDQILFLSKENRRIGSTLRYISIDIPVCHLSRSLFQTGYRKPGEFDLINMDKFYDFIDLLCHAKKSPFKDIKFEEVKEAKKQFSDYKLVDYDGKLYTNFGRDPLFWPPF